MQAGQRQGDGRILGRIQRCAASRISAFKIGISVNDGRAIIRDALFADVTQQVDGQANMPLTVHKTRKFVIAAIPTNRTIAVFLRGVLPGAAHPVLDNIRFEDLDGIANHAACRKRPCIVEGGDIDADAGRGPTSVKAAAADCDTSPIVVEAAAPGFAPVKLSIPVSVDAAKDGVLAVARATGSSFADGFSYLDSFVG